MNDTEEEARYSIRYDCAECGEENSVSLNPVSANPEDGDEYFCEECGWSEPY